MSVALAFGLSGSAMAEESLVCVPNFSVGYDFDAKTNTWHPTNFDITGERHTLHRKSGRMSWSTVGGPSQIDLGCTEWDANGFMKCGQGITVNRKRLRYLSAFTFGYATNEPDGEDTPMMEIGTCSVHKSY